MDPASLILYVFFLMCSAYFACTETAYTAVSKVRLRTMADKGNKRAQKALWICERFDKTLTTILVGNNIFHAACASLSALLVLRHTESSFEENTWHWMTITGYNTLRNTFEISNCGEKEEYDAERIFRPHPGNEVWLASFGGFCQPGQPEQQIQ